MVQSITRWFLVGFVLGFVFFFQLSKVFCNLLFLLRTLILSLGKNIAYVPILHDLKHFDRQWHSKAFKTLDTKDNTFDLTFQWSSSIGEEHNAILGPQHPTDKTCYIFLPFWAIWALIYNFFEKTMKSRESY